MFYRLILICLLLALPLAGNAQPVVAVTIKPLQLIAAAISDSVSEPVPVMRANASPHHYSMRPSERQALADADLLLWVGPALEGFLTGLSGELDSHVITIENLPGLHELLMGASLDPHLWLDLLNASLIARTLARELTSLDPANAEVYGQNLASFEEGLTATRQAIRTRITALERPAPYAVYHNAFQYFEAQFGLQHVLSFTDNEELDPGVRRLLEIKEAIDVNAVTCILVEPGTNIQQVDAIMGNIGIRYVPVDALGADIPVSANGYFEFMTAVSNAVIDCLE